MKNALGLLSVCCLLSSLGGCKSGVTEATDAGPDPDPDPDAATADGEFEVNRKLDILFVVDNSGSMVEEQRNLADNFVQLTTGLDRLAGGLPDLHIGVVSTNTGTSTDIQGCADQGDDGNMLTVGFGSCGPITGDFLSQTYGAGGSTTNFDGDLNSTFACVSQLGTNGCGFESPLESARRAVDPGLGRNPGFLRDDAVLMVVFLTDEDDCSVSDRGMFADPNADVTDPLGPLSSFRCFDFGVECDPDSPRDFGVKQNCQPRGDSPYMTPVQDFIDFFNDLKGPGNFVTMSIHGVPEDSTSGDGYRAEVVPNNSGGTLQGTPVLGPACTSAAGEAAPAIRMTEFTTSFPESRVSTICNQTLGLGALSPTIETALSIACLPAGSSTPTCSVTRTSPAGATSDVAICGGTGEASCYEVLADEPLCGGPALRYRSSQDETPGLSVVFDCEE